MTRLYPILSNARTGILLAVLLFGVALGEAAGLHAQQMVMSVPSRSVRAGSAVALDSMVLDLRQSDVVGLQMQLMLVGATIPSRNRVLVTPRLVAGRDSADFPSVELYGRAAYLHVARGGVRDTGRDMHFRATDVFEPKAYCQFLVRQPWMVQAQLKMVISELNGCDDLLYQSERWTDLPHDRLASSSLAALAPSTDAASMPPATGAEASLPAGTQMAHLQGQAYIDYPVNLTSIFPDYHDNQRELAGIKATLDSVLLHSTHYHMTLKGFASPEGVYASNERLARGRVHSLRQFLIDTYAIAPDRISVDYEPEDWEGLRRYVASAASSSATASALLKIIDSRRHPDQKLADIALRYPAAYRHLLDSVFPYLRRTDYRIDYFVETPTPGAPSSAAVPEASASASAAVPEASASVSPLLPSSTESHFRTFRPLVALKTNLLFDAALAPNIELEFPMGRRWSLMVEDWFPWFRFSHNKAGDANRYYRSDQRPTRHAYEIWALGAELRYWFAPRCRRGKPLLAGTFFGLYGAGGKYDVEHRSEGYQGEFTSFGVTLGHAWPLSRRWNLELSASAGYVGGPQRHYQAEFDDARLIFRNYDRLRYIGPTKLKLSVGWLIGK